MHRFQAFPLFMGSTGALFCFVCSLQARVATENIGLPLRWLASRWLFDILIMTAPWGFIIGLLMGVVAAWSERLHFGKRDSSGLGAAQRLMRNGLWLAFYALLVNITTYLIVLSMVKVGLIATRTYDYWYLGFFLLSFGSVNFAVTLWTLIRTSTTQDILSPRVLSGKLKKSIASG